jgi:hypothetical protein
MLLSSLRRLRLYCSGQASTLLTNTPANNRVLQNWLVSTSQDIESYLKRDLHIEQRTEYFDVDYGRIEYWLKAFPVVTLTSVYEDSTGLWDGGSESEIEDCIINPRGRLTLPYQLSFTGANSLSVIYDGGIAYDPVESIIRLRSGAGTFVAGKYVVGDTSGAVGIVTAYSSLSLTIEQYYGQFQVGEVLTQYEDEAVTASSPSVTGTISSFTRESLLNAYPSIVLACEMQIRYMRQHQMDFENTGTTKDGVTIRRDNPSRLKYPLQQEVLDKLEPYVRTWGL